MSSCKFKSFYSYIKTCSHITISATCHAHTHITLQSFFVHNFRLSTDQTPWCVFLYAFLYENVCITWCTCRVFMNWEFSSQPEWQVHVHSSPQTKKVEGSSKDAEDLPIINYWENPGPGDLPILIINYPIKTSSMVGSCCFYTPMLV